jgi:hypothetical protein
MWHQQIQFKNAVGPRPWGLPVGVAFPCSLPLLLRRGLRPSNIAKLRNAAMLHCALPVAATSALPPVLFSCCLLSLGAYVRPRLWSDGSRLYTVPLVNRLWP